jgi:hypothetical protein
LTAFAAQAACSTKGEKALDLQTMTSGNPDEAQKLWNEIAAERNTEINEPTAAVQPPTKTDDDAAAAGAIAATNEPEENANPEAGATGAADQSAATAAAAAQAAAAEQSKADPIKELAEQITNLSSKFDSQLRNIHGHIGGLTSTQKQMQEVLNASKQATAEVKEAPTQTQVAEAAKSPEEWERLREDFPEWATATEKLLDARLAGLQPQTAAIDQGAIDKIVEERVAKQTASVRTEVIDSHLDGIVDGDWRELVNTEQFGKWLDAQPDDVKKLGESNRITDAAKMLREFQKSRTSNQTQQIIDQRNAKLDAATTPQSKLRTNKTQKPIEDMTPAELWDYEARQREKARARG